MVRWKCDRCQRWNPAPERLTCSVCGLSSRETVKFGRLQTIGTEFASGDHLAQEESCPPPLPERSRRLVDVPPPPMPAAATCPPPPPAGATSRPAFEREESRIDLINAEIEAREANEKMELILLQFQHHSVQFSDAEFPANEASLYFRSTNLQNHPSVHWLRPGAMKCERASAQLEWTVFRSPCADDIEQGTLGNCWFLSALAAVAERPDLINNLFVTKEYQPSGAYQIRLCHGGQWKTVTIDDQLPCDQFNLLIYSQSRRKQLWVPLIEKAAAKLHGCYEALIAGHCNESLNMLTGAPCETLTIADFDQELLWANLLSNHEQKYIFGASSGSGGNSRAEEPSEEEYSSKGLKKKHAYSILDIQDVDGHRLVKLKNPWARVNWTGDWSSESPLWELVRSPDQRRRMRQEASGEGVFWMCIGDFMRYFTSIDVCRLRSAEWSEWRLPCHLPSLRMFHSSDARLNARRVATSVKVAIITVYQNTELEFVLQQAPVRHSANLSLVDLGMLIFRGNVLEDPQPKLKKHSRRMIRLVTSLHDILEPDIYSIVRYSFAPWLLSASNPAIDSVITIHSRGLISVTSENLNEECLRNAVIALVVAEGKPLKGRAGMTAYYLTKGWCGMLLVVENLMQSMHLHVECDCSESQNVVSSRGHLRTFDSVPPLSRQLIIVLTQLEIYERFTVSHRLLHRNSYNSALGDWGKLPRSQHDPVFEGRLHEPVKV